MTAWCDDCGGSCIRAEAALPPMPLSCGAGGSLALQQRLLRRQHLRLPGGGRRLQLRKRQCKLLQSRRHVRGRRWRLQLRQGLPLRRKRARLSTSSIAGGIEGATGCNDPLLRPSAASWARRDSSVPSDALAVVPPPSGGRKSYGWEPHDDSMGLGASECGCGATGG